MDGTGDPKIGKTLRPQVNLRHDDSAPKTTQQEPAKPDQFQQAPDYSKLKHPETYSILERLKHYMASGGKEEGSERTLRVRQGKLEPIQKEDVRKAAKADAERLPEKDLSLFEKTFLEKFRDGKSFGMILKKGEAHFKTKTEGEWSSFFDTLRAHVFQKRVPMKEVVKMIFRGFFEGQMVSDVAFRSGQFDKFARVPLKAETTQLLSQIHPGQDIPPQQLSHWLGALELAYFSLSYRPIQISPEEQSRAEAASRAANQASELMKKGKFGVTERAEQEAIQELALGEGYGLRSEKKKGRRAILSGLAHKEGHEEFGPLSDESAYIPWYLWLSPFKRKKERWAPRWTMILIYFLLSAFILTAILSIVDRFTP